MAERLSISDGLADALRSPGGALVGAAAGLAEDLRHAGLGPAEAASVVANMLLRAAWIVAASGRIAAGESPRPEAFAAAAADWAARIRFEGDPREVDGAAEDVGPGGGPGGRAVSALAAVPAGAAAEGPPVYPLPADAALGQFRTLNLHPHWLLGSELHVAAQTNRAGVAAWFFLLAQAFVTQSPGGTLPTGEAALADLAGFGADMDGWGAARPAALTGWSRVRVLAADGRDAGERLAHPVATAEAVRLWAEVERMGARRAANAADQACARVRGQLKRLGAGKGLFEPGRVEAMRRWLAEREMRITGRNVQAAIMATMDAGGGR
jgi:hypothetical protein